MPINSLLRGIFQPLPGDGHTSTLDLIIFSYRVFGLRSSPFEDGTLRHHASFKITPERHEQLACQRHDGDTADAAFRGTDTLACRDHRPDVSATLTTTTFNRSSLRWLGIST